MPSDPLADAPPILRKAVHVYSFLGGIMMFLISTTIRAEKRGSRRDAVIVGMGVCCNVFVREWLHGRARKDWLQSRERSTRATCERNR
jgi:hypothetical protein